MGMGKDFGEKFPVAKQWFERANSVLGYDLTAICFSGPEAELTKTENDIKDAVAAKLKSAAGIEDQAKQLENQASNVD